MVATDSRSMDGVRRLSSPSRGRRRPASVIRCTALALAIGFAHPLAGRADDAVSSVAHPPRAAVRNGTVTFDLPAVGAVLIDLDVEGEMGRALCTGTLIGCQTVLTAGHCACLVAPDSCCNSFVHPEDCELAYDIPADTGANRIRVFFQNGGLAEASTIALGAGDVAMIRLKEPVSGIGPAPLNRESQPVPGVSAMAAGFGLERYIDGIPQGAGIKRTALVPLISCEDLPNRFYLCSDASSADDPGVCEGDSGGPLFVDLGAGPVVAGVNSFGKFECVPPSGVFSSVLPWLTFVDTAAAGDLSGAACGDLPAVGAPGVTVHTFDGELTADAGEVRGDFEVPTGTTVLRATMNGVLITEEGRGNFDLFVEQDGAPSDVGCSDTSDIAVGACEIRSPSPGLWHVYARRVAGHGEVQLTVTLFGDGTAPSPSPAPSPTPPELCAGDCDGDRSVTIAELVRSVDIALGIAPIDDCPSLAVFGETITIDVLVRTVNAALLGCST